jgi:hypothetical protein
VLSLANPVRIPRVLIGKVSRTRTHAALLTALALAAAADCSSASSSASAGSGGKASADQQAVAAVVVRTLHDVGTNNYADLCTIIAPGSSVLASGIDGCIVQAQAAMMGAGQQSGAETFLSKASDLTVNASKVVVNGDSATAPKTALLYQGQPVTQFGGMGDENLIRKNGQWYLIMGS